MNVRVKVDGKFREVNCAYYDCPKKECFHAGRFTHYQTSIDGSRSSWQNEHYSCLYRDYHGCPDPAFETEEGSGR